MNTFSVAKKTFTEYLDAKGHRKTEERYVILKEIYKRKDHFDVESLYADLLRKKHSISRATVYNTLELLLECELVVRHQFGNNQAFFEKSYGYHQHDHLICLDCHKVLEFCDPRIAEIQNTVGNLLKFNIAHHSLNLYGNCSKDNCENKFSQKS